MKRLYREEWFDESSIKNFRLARIRIYRNLGMKELSKKVGIKLSCYSLIESMERYPNRSTRKKISRVLKEDINYLFPEKFKEYCRERRREKEGKSEDVLDRLNRVRFNAKSLRNTLDNDDYPELTENKERDEYIKEILNDLDLSEKTREVFNSRFEFEGRKFCELEKLGEKFHVTKQAISQREKIVIKKIRKSEKLKKLIELL